MLTAFHRWIGALSNSGRKTANMAGFYKGIQSAGAAVFWALDTAKVSYRVLYGVTVSLKFYIRFLTGDYKLIVRSSSVSAPCPSLLPAPSSSTASRTPPISRRI